MEIQNQTNINIQNEFLIPENDSTLNKDNNIELFNLKEENILLKKQVEDVKKDIFSLKSNIFSLEEKNKSLIQQNDLINSDINKKECLIISLNSNNENLNIQLKEHENQKKLLSKEIESKE